MGFKQSLVLCAILSLLSICVAEDVEVVVEGVTSIGETDSDFICATLDWWPTDKCDYDQCPWGKAGLFNLDLKNKILANAVRAFDPLRIRVGGSLEDQVVYQVGRGKECPPFKKQKDGRFGFSSACLPMKRWDELNQFFNQTRVKLTFSLNALMGKKKSSTDKTLWTGNWDPKNARKFMKYTFKNGYKIDSYELGNELCGGGVAAKVGAEEYAKDMKKLQKVVNHLYKHAPTVPKILGPGGFFDKQWFATFLSHTGEDVIHGLTHHIYNLGAGVDSNLINKVQDPYFLDGIAQTFKDVQETAKQYGPWAGAWVGESGGAYNSGGKDVSHTFADGFWYLDQLGMTSTFNHKVYCRQTLIGGNYGLLNTTSFVPNPDYYGALLFHRLMGTKVLSISHKGSPYLRAYSHCSKKGHGVTLLLINMSNSTSFDISVTNDMNLYPGKAAVSGQREEYHLTPKDGNIQSDVVLLNGTPLTLTASQDIPAMNPKIVNASEPIHVASDSFVFVDLKNFHAPACA